jgi:hypothetical protein
VIVHSLYIKVTNTCLLILLFCLTEDTSFGQKHIARVSVTSDESIVVQQKPVTLTASTENSLDEFVTETLLLNVRSISFEAPPSTERSISLNGRKSISYEHSFSMPCAVFADIECQFLTSKSDTPMIYPTRGDGLGRDHRQHTWKWIKELFLP